MHDIPLKLAAALALAAPATLQAQEPQTESEVIVVTGKTPAQTLSALEECLARGCPPEEDIRLSLEHAENVFLGGSYGDAQKTLRGSIRRTKGAADELPVPVSGLYRASARVAEHQGEGRDFQLATLDMRDTLENGLGDDHWRTMVAQIAVGDSRAKLGVPDDAERIYKRIERRAIEAGLPRIAMYARLRQALLDEARYASTKRDHWRRDSVELLTAIRDEPLEGGEEFAVIADVMLARIAKEDGAEDATDDLVRRFVERGGVDRPVLLYSEPLYSDEDLDRELSRQTSAAARLSTTLRGKPTWADIGFFVDTDGRVKEFEVLRAEGETAWIDQVKRHIESRRYAPVSDAAATPGFYLIERYTLTSRFQDTTTGSRLRRRSPVARIERLDITPENYAAPAL